MKKINIIISFIFLGILCMNAQEEIEVKKKDYLPKAGNFAIGTDVTPVLRYFGNFFNLAGTNDFDISGTAIYGKYFLTDESALRAVFSIGSGVNTDKGFARDDNAYYNDPLSNAKIVDSKKTSTNDFYLSLAWQNFIGKNRLRGFYGVQALFDHNYTKEKYVYGNPMSDFNQTPSSVYSYTNGERTLEKITAKEFKFGIGAIAGFEYYIIPRLCIGGEVSLNLVYNRQGQLWSKGEKVFSGEVVTVDNAGTRPSGGGGFNVETFRFDRESSNGPSENHCAIYLMFHF